jgi:hypothetical protein
METHDPLMETHYHLWKPFLKNNACLRKETLFLMLNVFKNIPKKFWVSTALWYNCSLHMEFEKNSNFFLKKFQIFG